MAEADVFQILTGGRERSEPPGVRRLAKIMIAQTWR